MNDSEFTPDNASKAEQALRIICALLNAFVTAYATPDQYADAVSNALQNLLREKRINWEASWPGCNGLTGATIRFHPFGNYRLLYNSNRWQIQKRNDWQTII